MTMVLEHPVLPEGGDITASKSGPVSLRAALRSRGGAHFESVPKVSKVAAHEGSSTLDSGSLSVLLHSLEKQLKAPWLASEVSASENPSPLASGTAQPSLRDVLRSRGGVQFPAHQKSSENVQPEGFVASADGIGPQAQLSVTAKVTELLGALESRLDPTSASHASAAVSEKVTDLLGSLGSTAGSQSVAATFSSLTNGVSTLFDSIGTQQPEKKENDAGLASVLRRRGGALAEDPYESFFEYRSEPQKELAAENSKKDSDDEGKAHSNSNGEGTKNSLAAVLRRRGGSVAEDGFETFFEYKSAETPKDCNTTDACIKKDCDTTESPWTDQIRRNLKKPQSFHLPENDIEVDSPQNRNQSSDTSRFMQLQSLWESRTPYAGACLNDNTRISKTEAQAALQRLSMKTIFGPGDLDEVRKLRQALLDADDDLSSFGVQ
jgi:hypothetical protein